MVLMCISQDYHEHVQYEKKVVPTQVRAEVVKADGSKHKLYIAMIGIRGDWPWQRVLAACQLFHPAQLVIATLTMSCETHACTQVNATCLQPDSPVDVFVTFVVGRTACFSFWF